MLALQTITDTVLHKINTALAYTGISTFYDNVKRTQQLILLFFSRPFFAVQQPGFTPLVD